MLPNSNMLLRPSVWAALLCYLAARPVASQSNPASPIPHLERRGDATQLIVDGKPFLILGGELFNNSATSLDYMRPVWPRLAAMRLNTVLVPVSWALLEPVEGKFDYTLVDGLIRGARDQNLHIVFLWFGSWKNTWSSYAPDWVKRDLARFARVQLLNGSGTERLSPFCDAGRSADARAFGALMRRIKEVDSGHAVIMVQVENEVGVIPDARDHSPAANDAYGQPVPAELMEYLERHKETMDPDLRAKWQAAGFKASGNWEAVFGSGLETEDLFMAWHYARYIGKVAEAGKAEYNLPMFANAALIRPDYAPGQYNSGGPLPHSFEIWQAGAPQLDFLAPDIYFEFKKWSAKYDRPPNPLFIPEAAGGAQGAANVFYAVGSHRAFGFSPFAIDGTGSSGGGGEELARSYDVLSQLAPLILENQPKGRVAGVLLEDLTPSQKVRLGGYTLNVSKGAPQRIFPGEPAPSEAPRAQTPHGIFIAAAPDEFYMAGSGLTITFSADTPGPPIVGLATVEEGRFVDGRWVRGRVLAGDDTGQGNSVSLGSAATAMLRVTVYRYR